MSHRAFIVVVVMCVLQSCYMVPLDTDVRQYIHKSKDTRTYVVVKKSDTVIVLVMLSPGGKYECLGKNETLYQEITRLPVIIMSKYEGEKFVKDNAILIGECANQLGLKRVRRTNPILNRIFPGTKWCGVGNIAANDSDYGEEIETDKCCQAHDKCKKPISDGGKTYNYKTSLGYHLSPCSCDDTFYLCLKDADTLVSERIGVWFFNNVNMRCYEVEMVKTCVAWYIPAVWCKKYEYKQGIQVYNGQSWN